MNYSQNEFTNEKGKDSTNIIDCVLKLFRIIQWNILNTIQPLESLESGLVLNFHSQQLTHTANLRIHAMIHLLNCNYRVILGTGDTLKQNRKPSLRSEQVNYKRDAKVTQDTIYMKCLVQCFAWGRSRNKCSCYMVTLILFYFSVHSLLPGFVFHSSPTEGNLVYIQYILNNQ